LSFKYLKERLIAELSNSSLSRHNIMRAQKKEKKEAEVRKNSTQIVEEESKNEVVK